MKKQIKKAITLSLTVVLLATSLVACGQKAPAPDAGNQVTEAPKGEDGNGETPAPTETPEVSKLPETLENPNITILWHTSEEAFLTNQANDPNSFDGVWSVIPAFEAKYGGKVNVVAVGWGDMKDTLIGMVNGGEACDLAQANDQNFPIYPVKKLVQPIGEYVDLQDDFWYKGVTNAFTFGGEAYAVGTDATPIVLYYNKSLYESNGVKSPGEYYAEGNWNWDTFKEAAINITGDTDGDSVVDQFGFGWWDGDYGVFMTTNGVTNMAYREDGTIGTNFANEAAKEAVQFIQDAYIKDKYIDVTRDGDYFMNDFKSGKLGMTLEYGFNGFGAYASDYEIDFVPLPQGPKGVKNHASGGLSGWVVPITATNGDGAAAFVRMSCEMALEHNNSMNTLKYGEEKVNLIGELAQNVLFAPIGIEKYWDANWTIVSGIREGTPVSTFLQVADEQIAEGVQITLEQ